MPERTVARFTTFSFTLTLLFISFYSVAQTRILFDATKGEMAGNADWIIDADQWNVGVGMGGAYVSSSAHKSNPQQIPTPPQNGITAATSETYWSGGLSAWGVDCAKKGYTVETLPWNGEISYGNTSNPQDLSNYKVYIVDEPNLQFNSSEKTAIIQFVQSGGSLFIIADHTSSDRNGDGWDSPGIWNDLFSNNSITSNPFGITFDLLDFSQTTTNISASATDPIIHGTMGNVTRAQWAGGTTMTLNPTKNPSIKGVVFKTGSAPGNTNAMVAYGTYGSGKVAAMGDSSPTDDGTGNPDCTLYDGYFGDASGNHQLLLMNITIWLASNTAATDNTIVSMLPTLSVYPNPATNEIHIAANRSLTNVRTRIYNISGENVANKEILLLNEHDNITFSLPRGSYFAAITSDQATQTLRFTVN